MDKEYGFTLMVINMMENIMVNIVIPMAGIGGRFIDAGYENPKPFIDVAGKPMIVRVLENLYYPSARYILLARKEHLESEYLLVKQIERQFKCSFISIDKITEGTACTVLFAKKYINNEGISFNYLRLLND